MVGGAWRRRGPAAVVRHAVVATKGRFPAGGDPTGSNSIGNSRRHLSRALTDSLRRLRTDAIDLYQVHAWDPLTPLEETISFLEDAVTAGTIRYYGLSNFVGWQIQKADLTATRHRPVTVQVQYNLLAREVEWEVVPACLDAGIGVLPWSPLAGGLLTGRYKRETRVDVSRVHGSALSAWYEPRIAQDRTWEVLEVLPGIAARLGASVGQVALAWLAARPGVSSVVLGARTIEQFRDNLGAVDVKLSTEDVTALDDASQPQVDYPYNVRDVEIRSRNHDGSYPSLH